MTARGPVLRWTVGSGADLRERLLWRGELEPTFVTGVDCTRLPDGKPIAVCGTGDDRWLQVWDLAAGTVLGRPSSDLPGDRMRFPMRVACTDLGDGTPVAVTLGADDALRVWDLVPVRMRAATSSDAVTGHRALACTVLPDGTAIAVTAGGDGAVRFWDVATARPYGRPVTCEEPSPEVACPAPVDGTSLVIIADGTALKVWDLSDGRFHDTRIETGFSSVWRLACMRLADGTVLAVAGSGREWDEATGQPHGLVRAWDVATGRPYGPPSNVDVGEIRALACTQLPDGPPIAVAVGRYGSTTPFNLRSGLAHGPSLPHLGDGPAVACVRLPDGRPVVVVADEDIGLWSLDVRASPQGLAGPVRLLGCAALPGGAEVLVTAGHHAHDGFTVQLWEAGTGRPRGRMLAGAADRARGCLRTSDGAAVVTVTPDGRGVQLCDLGSGEVRDRVLAGHTAPVTVIACLDLDDGTPIVITGGGSVRAWRADTGHPYGPPLPLRIVSPRAVSCLRLPDETLVVVSHDTSTIEAWDGATGHRYGISATNWSTMWSGWSGVTDCVTLLNGTLVAVRAVPASTRSPAVVRAWNLDTGRAYGGRVHLRASRPNAIACSRLPDGAVIAAVGGGQGRDEDHVVEVVDPIGGRRRYEIAVRGHVRDLGFTAGHRLIVGTDLDVAVYDLL